MSFIMCFELIESQVNTLVYNTD